MTEATQSTGGALGRDAFLQLLTTQMKYQDPLNPMDNTQFVAQLAQFSQLEQLTNMNQTMETSSRYLASLNNFNAAGLIGKNVSVKGGGIPQTEGSSAILSYSLAGNAANVNLQVSNSAGAVIRVINTGPQAAGIRTVSWDGLDANGNKAPTGTYIFAVKAVDAAGAPVDSVTYSQGQVSGVQYNNGVANLIVNGLPVAMSSVLQIY